MDIRLQPTHINRKENEFKADPSRNMSWRFQKNHNWVRFLEDEITLEELQAELKRIAVYLATDESKHTTIPSWSPYAIKARRAARQ